MAVSESDRLIYHIDVNSAFLSWESIYRLSQDPSALDLRLIPSAVGGDAKSRHGIVLAKSTSAKKFGIRTGEPLTQAIRKCPSLTVVPARFDFYIQCSEKMMSLLEEYTPDHEQFSIDEIFLDMTQTIHLFGDPIAVADSIRQRIHHELGFTVNIGISTNKLLAKMASDFEKPDRCHTLFPEEVPSKMWPLPVGELFFVGDSARRKMESIGIRSIGQLAAADPDLLKSCLGNKYAFLIRQYANGIDPDPVAKQDSLNKCYGNRITLPRDVRDFATARHVLLSLCETLGARLRADHILCQNLCVELKDWTFNSFSHQMNLPDPTDSTNVLYSYACQLLQECWDLRPLRLLGVRAGKILDESCRQLSLFESAREKKQRKLETAVDQIRSRYGVDSIKRACFLDSESIVDHASGKKKHLSRPDFPGSTES